MAKGRIEREENIAENCGGTVVLTAIKEKQPQYVVRRLPVQDQHEVLHFPTRPVSTVPFMIEALVDRSKNGPLTIA